MTEPVCEDVADVLDPEGRPVHIPGCWSCVNAPDGEHNDDTCTCPGSRFSRWSQRQERQQLRRDLVRGPNVVDFRGRVR